MSDPLSPELPPDVAPRAKQARDELDAHVRDAVRECPAVDRISIPDQKARLGAVAGESLDDLLRRPRG